eukprot:577330-Pleurochrysis_carterae.AAC.1
MLLAQLSVTAWTDSKPSEDFQSDASDLPKYRRYQETKSVFSIAKLVTFSLLASFPASGTAHIILSFLNFVGSALPDSSHAEKGISNWLC